MRLLARIVLASAVLASTFVTHAGLLGPRSGEQDIPSAEEAFVVQPALWDGRDLIVGWTIAPGCYLYREKLVVEAVAPLGYALGKATLPEGQVHHDEHFGDVVILRNEAQLRFRPASGTPPASLRIRYQGCAEGKVCYPIQTRTISVQKP